jgi:hypothetical protein
VKLKNDVVNPTEVQQLVNQAIDKKLIQMNLKDDTAKSKEGVSKMQAQVNSIVTHYNVSQDQITNLTYELEQLNKQIEGLHRKTEKDKANYIHRIELVENALTDVREDCIANSDSFIVNVEARLDNIDQRIKANESKRELKKVPQMNQSGVSEQYINALRKDIDYALKKLNLKLNDVDKKSDVGIKTSEELVDLQQRVNEIDDHIETADMNINKKVNLLQTTPISKAPNDTSSKAVEGRLARLETIAVRHGKLLDNVTENISILIAENKKLNEVVQKQCVCEEYTEDFANKIKLNFDSRIGALEAAMQDDDEAEFREQVFKEIDGIKSAAIEDIK